jgi:hypothetical protein
LYYLRLPSGRIIMAHVPREVLAGFEREPDYGDTVALRWEGEEGAIRTFYNVYLDSHLNVAPATIGLVMGVAQLLPIGHLPHLHGSTAFRSGALRDAMARPFGRRKGRRLRAALRGTAPERRGAARPLGLNAPLAQDQASSMPSS